MLQKSDLRSKLLKLFNLFLQKVAWANLKKSKKIRPSISHLKMKGETKGEEECLSKVKNTESFEIFIFLTILTWKNLRFIEFSTKIH